MSLKALHRWVMVPVPRVVVGAVGGALRGLALLAGQLYPGLEPSEERIMSDLASQLALTRTPTHLPLSWYFDPKVAEIEKKLLFDRGPGYVGHAAMAPEPGSYRVLDWRESGPGWVLVNNDGRHDMVSNVCRHRQAVMLKGAGQLPGGTITCPVHRWAYDGEGRHIGAPHFPDHPCLDLPRQGLQQWHAILFNGPRDIARDLAAMGAAKDLDFEGYVLDRVDVVDYDFN